MKTQNTRSLWILCQLVAAALLTACATQEPQVQLGGDAETLLGKLHRVDNTRAAFVYVDPNVDFSQYTKFLLDELNVDQVEIVQPDGSRNKPWVLEDRDKEFLRDAWRNAMVNELTNNGYDVVTEPGNDVLRITASINQIAPTAPKDDFTSRPAGRSQIHTDGAGSVVASALFSDSSSGEVIALLKDAKKTGSGYLKLNNRVSNTADIKRIFASWARQFRARLDIIHG